MKKISTRKKTGLMLIILGGFFALIALFISGLKQNPQELPSMLIGKPLPAFSLPTLDEDQHYNEQDLPQTGVYLINIWGSWCPSCHQEHAYLMELAKRYRIIGINWPADNPDEKAQAKQFLAHKGNPYQLVLMDEKARFITDLGVYGAPETFLVKDGKILYRHAGLLDESVWQRVFLPYLTSAK